MAKFSLGERYRLEVRWKEVKYERSGICKLVDAYFSGPVLKEAEKINDNDSIMLDFYNQYVIFVKNVYVGKLSWKAVIYSGDGTITITDAQITHDTELNRVPQLKDDDYLVIDTSNHEIEVHAFNLLYTTYVVNAAGELYDFRSM